MSRAAYRKADAVRADLLAATVDLLSQRPARDVTVRDIAERAGVQHSMITRHFGSKRALVADAVAYVSAQYAGAVCAADDPADGYALALRHLRSAPASGLVLTASDDRRRGDDAEERFPGLTVHLQQLLDAGADDDLETRVLAGLLISTVIAWGVGRDTVMDAMDIPRDRTSEVDRIAEELVGRLVTSQLPTDRRTEHPPH
jgi:AcrR family transcriptional regulator